jgi:hypothetical protein
VARCSAYKRDGTRCTLQAEDQQGVCWAHDPKNAEQRRRRASKGGKAKASKVVKGLLELLEDLTIRVVEGKLETSKGAVANQLIGTRIRLLEYERRLKELEELEERLAALEQAQGGGQRWGA